MFELNGFNDISGDTSFLANCPSCAFKFFIDVFVIMEGHGLKCSKCQSLFSFGEAKIEKRKNANVG
jgi:hypothetical protein